MLDEEEQLLRSPSDEDTDAERSLEDIGGQGDVSGEGSKLSVGGIAKIIIPSGIGIFLAAMDKTSVASSYAAIGSDMGQLQNAGWIATSYMLTLTSFQPVYGKLSDIFGRKWCLLFAYVVYALGCLSCALAGNMAQLVAARALAGLGGGGMTTLASIIVTDTVPLRTRGSWQGVLNTIFALGALVGAPLGGGLADGPGWRWTFLLQLPLSMFAILTVTLLLQLPVKHTGERFMTKLQRIDVLGALLMILSVSSILFGLDRGGNVAWSDQWTFIALILACTFGSTLIFVECRLAEEPFAPPGIIAKRTLIIPYLCNFFTTGADASLFFYVPLYYQAVANKSAAQVGTTLMPVVLAPIIGSFGGGLLIQKTGRYYHQTICAFSLQLGGALIVLVSATQTSSLLGVTLGLTLATFGTSMGVTSTLVALVANAGPPDQAVATAVSYLFRSLGGVIGVSVGGAFIQNTLRALLRSRLTGKNLDIDEIVARVRASLAYIDELEPTLRDVVRGSYREAVSAAFLFSTAFAFLAIAFAFFVHESSLSPKSATVSLADANEL